MTQTAAEIWTQNIRQIRNHYMDQRDALYERWLSSDMDCWTRDRLHAGINASEDAAVELEKELYYSNRAREAA